MGFSLSDMSLSPASPPPSFPFGRRDEQHDGDVLSFCFHQTHKSADTATKLGVMGLVPGHEKGPEESLRDRSRNGRASSPSSKHRIQGTEKILSRRPAQQIAKAFPIEIAGSIFVKISDESVPQIPANICESGTAPAPRPPPIQQDIRMYFERKWYPESLYLLAMLDYISRENDVPLCDEYDDLRRCRLENTIYLQGVLAMSAASKTEDELRNAEVTAIPEFKRFNIIESEVRNVI